MAAGFKPLSGQQWRGSFSTVSDLLDGTLGRWKDDVVRQVFCAHEASMVLSLPLPRTVTADMLVWAATDNGLFNTKSAYQLVLSSHDGPSTSMGDDRGGLWSSIWKTKSIPRCRDMMWRICHGFLPTAVNLSRRGVDMDLLCPMCGEGNETTTHALLFCPAVAPIWFMSPLSFAFHGSQPANFSMEAWLRTLLDQKDEWVIDKVSTLLYAIWARRNLWVFDQRWLTLEQTLKRAAAMEVVKLDDFQGLGSAGLNIAQVDRQDVWQPPPRGSVKVNVDASFKHGEVVGTGMVVREADGGLLLCASGKMVGALSAAMAETMALRWALGLVLEMGNQWIVVETDCAVLHSTWRSAHHDRSYLAAVVQDCVALSTGFSSFSFVLVRRNANRAADYMAKFALSNLCFVWFGNFPMGLEHIIASDVSSLANQ
ncbi:uncharacterized protein LOC130736960 [Lotus japonicus]|uniref:uncharacterized protein LOC130736960 n=1 Tax=Lotus japonicus TaxID=34305 RepID=UPI002587C08E|nr:uncharacterized protein LOC130736960 [Lotus japonicus]